MLPRITRLAFATVAAAGLTTLGMTAAQADDAGLDPANTAVHGVSADLQFSGTLSGLSFSSSCTEATLDFTTPAGGLGPIDLSSTPSITGCTDNFGGNDTITASGTWQVTWQSAGQVTLTIPQGGATFSTSFLPGCTVTAASDGPVQIVGTYDNVNKAVLPAGTSIPFSASGCGTTSGSGTVGGTYTLSPNVSVTS